MAKMMKRNGYSKILPQGALIETARDACLRDVLLASLERHWKLCILVGCKNHPSLLPCVH